MAYIYDFPNFLPSVVKHVFLKKLCVLSIQHPSSTYLHYLFTLHHRSSYHGKLFFNSSFTQELDMKMIIFLLKIINNFYNILKTIKYSPP